MIDYAAQGDTQLRELAVKRLKKRRDFYAHLLIYVMMNTLIVLTWFMTGANGLFWPVFPIALWGIGVVMQGWDTFHDEEFGEDRIQREINRLQNH
jgi:cytochrome b561